MAEVYSWAEGSAYIWTGGASTSALLAYARNITVTRQVTYAHYRPPKTTTYVNYPHTSGATLSIGQLYADATLQKMFNSATGGGYHVHLKNLVGGINQSGGTFLYSGNLTTIDIGGADGALSTLSINGIFPSWGDY